MTLKAGDMLVSLGNKFPNQYALVVKVKIIEGREIITIWLAGMPQLFDLDTRVSGWQLFQSM